MLFYSILVLILKLFHHFFLNLDIQIDLELSVLCFQVVIDDLQSLALVLELLGLPQILHHLLDSHLLKLQ